MTFEDDSSVYVGGLAYTSTEEDLQEAFEAFGEIQSVKIVYDRETGESRGFGFVTFANPRSASKAIAELDGRLIGGRPVRVNEVRKHAGMKFKFPNYVRSRDIGIRDKERDRFRDGDRSLRVHVSPPRSRRTSSPAFGRAGRAGSPVNASVGRSGRGRSPDMSSSQGRSGRARSPVPRRSFTPLKEPVPSRDSSSAGGHRPRLAAASRSPPSAEKLRPVQGNSVRVPPPPTSRIIKLDKGKGLVENVDVLKVPQELDKAHQSRQELEEKITRLTSSVAYAEETVAALHNRSKKLEEALENSTALANSRQLLLRRIQRSILQVKESSERLNRQERDLKILISSVGSELDVLEEGDEMGNGGLAGCDLKTSTEVMMLRNDQSVPSQ